VDRHWPTTAAKLFLDFQAWPRKHRITFLRRVFAWARQQASDIGLEFEPDPDRREPQGS
jgi:hypothetical protein